MATPATLADTTSTSSSTSTSTSTLFGEQVVSGRPIASQRKVVPKLAICNLGSGSGGNATLVRTVQHQHVLIDAGFGPRTTAQRLHQLGLTLHDLDAICLTHLDQDHFRPSWLNLLSHLPVKLHVHRWHADDLKFLVKQHNHRNRLRPKFVPVDLQTIDPVVFDDQPFNPVVDLRAVPIRLQHDRQGTIGYRLEQLNGHHQPIAALGYATDLGHAPPALIEHFAGVDLLAIEANYDERMTINSPRPSFVNRRNLSDSGHLSNEQACTAALHIDARTAGSNPKQIVLLHRSSQCNHPTKLRRVFEKYPHLAKRIYLTEQRRRTRWFQVQPQPQTKRAQLTFAF